MSARARIGSRERRDRHAARRRARRRGRIRPASLAAACRAAARTPRRAAMAARARSDCRARSRSRRRPRRRAGARSASHGLRLSESDSAQKSWPSGAPTRAATASIAVTPGTMVDVERAPGCRSRLDLLAHRRRHGEHAGIAARHQRDAGALRRVAQRGRGARAFLAVVGRMPALAGTRRHAIEIGAVAVKRVAPRERGLRLRRERSGASPGPSPITASRPLTARSSQPGTSTIAK